MKNLNLRGTGFLILVFALSVFSCRKTADREHNVRSEEILPQKSIIDPLHYRWTFGNHEPISMYRRAGNRVTGGMEGSALWLEEWHHWYDSDSCPRLMEELGLNILHSRFYKGMGWDFESRDFPNVKRFVDNCHKHGITVLAYVQFSTLYYETMLSEVPDLANWAAQDENGEKLTWNSVYYRWIPCANSPDFENYLKEMVKIALTEGNFDGIMFDNCHIPACYCPRCVGLFREYLGRKTDPVRHFGISSVEHVLPPVLNKEFGELQDPISQEWVKFRCERATNLYRRLYAYAKSCKSTAIVSGNIQNIRRGNMAGKAALDMEGLKDCFDIFVSQSGNAPGLKDGNIINRVRELKLAQALNTPILALCDDDAGAKESAYLLTLMEDAVFGGIPTDRTIMKSDRQMVSPELVAFRKPLLQRFNTTVRDGRESFSGQVYSPVKILYSYESVMLSEQAYQALLGAEEILLRNHVPYGLLPVKAGTPLNIPGDCELLLACDQRCLDDPTIQTLIDFTSKGGKLIATGKTGEYDENYRQRRQNLLPESLLKSGSGLFKAENYPFKVSSSGWTISVREPVDGGRVLMEDIARLWEQPFTVQAPPTVFLEARQSGEAFYIHLLNYIPEPVTKARITFAEKGGDMKELTFSAPMENQPALILNTQAAVKGSVEAILPAFSEYAVVKASRKKQGS